MLTTDDRQPLSAALLHAILDDRVADACVNRLVWCRLGYEASGDGPWAAGPTTPSQWREAYPFAPDFIAERPATVRLTRSIATSYKQLLKQQLGFTGYRIGELQPRRTRRATVVNWLLAWLAERGETLADADPLTEPIP